MRMLTIKAKPKMIFGIIIALTGIIVILLSFVGNHSSAAEKATQASVICQTAEQRQNYINSLGWKTDGNETKKEITVPTEFNNVYNQYNDVQKKQGFDLEEYKGQKAIIYTYNITNYRQSQSVVADLIVVDGILVGADLCDISADNGFLTSLDKNDNG